MKKKPIRKNKVEEESEAEVGYGSIYAQLEYKNSEEMETKSNLVIEIAKAIKKKKAYSNTSCQNTRHLSTQTI